MAAAADLPDGETTDDEYESKASTCVLDKSHQHLERVVTLLDADTYTHATFEGNLIPSVGEEISAFQNLHSLNLSNNCLVQLSPSIVGLHSLRILVAKHNQLQAEGLPSDFGSMQGLEELNLSANNFTQFPVQLTELTGLRRLYLASNGCKSVPYAIKNLRKLELLYLGDNKLTEIPASIGYLRRLRTLVVSSNRIETLPPVIGQLKKLQSLALHNNRLKMLPLDIVKLSQLEELSLRGNPLVYKFVRDLTYSVPSLLELAARTVKVAKLTYGKKDLPSSLVEYLNTAKCCVNPRCKGVYFDSRVEHVKFSDFCGKYRVPLLDYLCSPSCSEASPLYEVTSGEDGEGGDNRSNDADSTSGDDVPSYKLAKVLLG